MNNQHKLILGDAEEELKKLDEMSIDCIVTSPPYFNARDYIQYQSFDDYMDKMKRIMREAYRVLKNHRAFILNVGDIVGQVGDSRWSKRKLPLGAYWTVMMEEIGFEFIDDYIWDKGEPQSKRHLGNPPYPFYQYPVNAYEHIIIFEKHKLDKTKIACPECNKIITNSNSQTRIGVQSWECKNPKCPAKSPSGRGKRFSQRSIMMSEYQREENLIPEEFTHRFRRDIVSINPVIKINSKGSNLVGHSAPFPEEIPELAIRYFSGVGDVVLDMFSGSGTTGIVAKKLNRQYIGIDVSEEYVELSKRRILNEDRHRNTEEN